MNKILTLGRLIDSSKLSCRTLSLCTKHLKAFEPDYLDTIKSAPKSYPPINVQIRGYDFDIIESYQGFVHAIALKMGINVSDDNCWATPPETLKVETYCEGGTNTRAVHELRVYERNVHIESLKTVDAGPFIDALRTSTPPGVSISIHKHKEEHLDSRYITDPFMDMVKGELKVLTDKKNDEIRKALAKRGTKK